MMAFAMRPGKKITIWMIGDSTMSIKEKKAYPETGWGMPFVYFWDSTVTVKILQRMVVAPVHLERKDCGK